MEIRDGNIIHGGKSYPIRRLIVQVMTNELPHDRGDYLIDWFTVQSDAPRALNDAAVCLLANHFRCTPIAEERDGEPLVAAWTGVPAPRVDTWFTF